MNNKMNPENWNKIWHKKFMDFYLNQYMSSSTRSTYDSRKAREPHLKCSSIQQT